MAEVIFNSMIKEIHGAIGDVVYRVSSSTGKTYISKRPDMSRVKWSKAQKNQRTNFSLANEYAQEAMEDPDRRAVYEAIAVKEHRQPYRVAFSDYFKGKDLLSKR